ncbi:MAG: TonB family protein [Candidatus Cryptobacteroides sp.]
MKHRTFPVFLFCALFISAFPIATSAQYRTGYSELDDSDVVRTLRSHISYLASPSLEGRGAGTEGEEEAASYVRDILESYGVEMLSGKDGDIFGIAQENGDTLTSRNVLGFVQGYDKELNDRFIVVGARLDNIGKITVEQDGQPVDRIYCGANGNASGLALMLELARMVSTNSILFRRSVIFIAFGASEQSFAGSWYFLNRSFGDAGNIDAMINLDMLGTGNSGFFAYTSSNPDMNMILSQVGADLQPVTPELTSREPFPSDHRSFYSKEISSVLFTTGRYPERGTVRDTEDIIEYEPLERELEYIYNFTVFISNVKNAPLFRQDKLDVRTDDRLYTYDECDKKPVFMGNSDVRMFLVKWVYQYLRYPKQAVENGIQGRVTVGFTIGKNGKVKDVRVIRGADDLLDEEAVRVVAASPDWKAGRVKGVNVDVAMSVAVDFKLEKKGKFGIKK